MYADSHESFNDSYLELGQKAGFLDDKMCDEKGMKVVKDWLDSPASCNWIMIIDNFDDVDSYPAKYLPLNRGAILYTSRDGRLVGNYVASAAGVHITAMSNEEGLAMLSKLLVVEGAITTVNSEDVLELLHQLEYLPLAIAQTAAYIRETGVDVSIYLEMFKECE